MEAFLVSMLVVAAGEMGDKTQLLALLLATRFRSRGAIVLGILAATLANHTLAGALGVWLRGRAPVDGLRWIIAATFLAMALWALKADRLDEHPREARGPLGVFAVTAASFFMVEMGDKTQIATVALAAQFDNLQAVVAGTTLGMLVADVPIVWLGRAIAAKISLRAARLFAAALFAALALVAIFAG
ncbi:MAG TPA: TMEM165/GDT1 family protein [Casimicrobiaceae bacterium]|nr:TMEM165/GDT1 family protein [Casimicrobiaceae bacterium]